MSAICQCGSVKSSHRPDYRAPYQPARTTPDALGGSYQSRVCTSGHSCQNAYYQYAHSTASSRIQQLSGLLQDFRRFSPAELELAWMMSQLNGHGERYTADAAILSQLSGIAAMNLLAPPVYWPATAEYVSRQYADPVTPGRKIDFAA